MKAWGSLFCLVCASVFAAAAPALAVAKPNTSRGRGIVLSSFEMKGTNGYAIEGGEVGAGHGPPTAAINVARGQVRASYQVPGETGPGLRAAFGSLGSVSFSFHRHKRAVSHLEPGCAFIEETGVFRGSFSFVGEGNFTEASATSAPGTVTRLPHGFCGFGGDRANPRVPDMLRATTLVAREATGNGFVEFSASTLHADHELGFDASLQEQQGPMKILRSAGGAELDGTGVLAPNERGAIVVDPPTPFVGSASFRDPADGPSSWTGSLSVSLPGAPGVMLTGPGFAARLCRSHFILRQCKIPPSPQRDGRARAQGSGSHSQAFRDARLSWSR